MEEIAPAFDRRWSGFKDTVSAVAKSFGNYHQLDRFRDVCILNNDAVPQDRTVQLKC